jgi:4-amino-4-deoxy-L-arabinose transferase-like glycosyltransferase
LISLWCYPLTDKTEARYGELARETAINDTWIMPQLEPDQPFWAKPSLSSWAGGIGIKLFGVHAAAVRLPAFFAGLIIIACVGIMTLSLAGSLAAWWSALAAATMPVVLVMTGGVMTDPYLVAGTSLSLLALVKIAQQPENTTNDSKAPHWPAWLYGLGLAIGLMAKGPIAAIFIGLPTLALLFFSQRQYFFSLRWLVPLVITVSPVVT